MAAALMNRKHIAAHFQVVVKAAYGITIKEELKKWTSHYIREGPCVLIIEGGHYGPFIKIRLHWKSYTFLLYLRNTAHMAAQHSATIS